jgi:hypothetical protein
MTTLNKIATLILDEDDISLSKITNTLTPEALERSFEDLLEYFKTNKPDDTPVLLKTILSVTNLDYSLLCLRTCEDIDTQARMFGVHCAKQVSGMVVDERIVRCVNIAEEFALGSMSLSELYSNYVYRGMFIVNTPGFSLKDDKLILAMKSCHSTIINSAAKAALHASTYAFYADHYKASAYDHSVKFKQLFC